MLITKTNSLLYLLPAYHQSTALSTCCPCSTLVPPFLLIAYPIVHTSIDYYLYTCTQFRCFIMIIIMLGAPSQPPPAFDHKMAQENAFSSPARGVACEEVCIHSTLRQVCGNGLYGVFAQRQLKFYRVNWSHRSVQYVI